MGALDRVLPIRLHPRPRGRDSAAQAPSQFDGPNNLKTSSCDSPCRLVMRWAECVMSGLFWTVRHQQIAHRNQYRLAILIQSCHPHLDQPKVRTRLRWPHLENFTLNVQLIAWSHRTRPAQLIEAGPDDPACGPELALDQEAHGRRSSMPTARYQTVKYRMLRCRGVEMER